MNNKRANKTPSAPVHERKATQRRVTQRKATKSRTTESRAAKPRATRSRQSSMPLVLALVFLAMLIGAAWWHMLPIAIVGLYLLLSLCTFIAYAFDKSAARKGRWRTKESTLHLMSLLGGWPGALFAQQLLRHKSVKAAFRQLFWLTVVTNLALLGYGIQTGFMDRLI
uniref:Cold-shock DNA-binding domain protein n=1 Tax=Shewanella sp. (strain MR-7) TaxID=60481 RepID=Q0HSN8_SHESR